MPKALSPLQSDQRSYTSELSVVSPVWLLAVEFGESEKKKLVSKELLERSCWSCWGVAGELLVFELAVE
jgi:hypothetical protein